MKTNIARAAVAAFSIVAALAVTSGAAEAKCTRLGFSVNDYGKEGPARDAKNLLDKHIAAWAAERGIKKYSVGKKDVTCELFIDLIVFDEYTCKATASVCWNEAAGAKPAAGKAPTLPAEVSAPRKATPAKAAPAPKATPASKAPAKPADAPAAPAPAKTKTQPG